MNRLFTFLLLLLTLNVPSHAILFFHEGGKPVLKEELLDGQRVHPDVCKINYIADDKNPKEYSSKGTGVFLSPNVVLTARHVISHDEVKDDKGISIRTPSYIDMIRNLSQISVLIQDTTLKVKCIEIFEDGHEDFALLILETSFTNLNQFRQVRATCIGDKIPSVSVMGYGAGRIVSKSERVLAELDDAHLETPQLRFRNNLKPIASDDFKVEGHPWISLYDKIAKTYRKDREYPQFDVRSGHVRMMSGDSGAPILDENGFIFGVLANGNAKFCDDEKAIMDKYEDFIVDTVPIALHPKNWTEFRVI